MQKSYKKYFAFFALPTLVAFAIAFLIPFIMGIYYTFTNYNGANPQYDFVGISNYTSLFSDDQFMYSLKITILYTFASVITINLVGFGLAYAVTRKLKTN